MANQKISQLTEQTDLSLIDGLAGYQGTSNVQISGPNIISAIPTIYTADGTLSGDRTITAAGNDLQFNFEVPSGTGGFLQTAGTTYSTNNYVPVLKASVSYQNNPAQEAAVYIKPRYASGATGFAINMYDDTTSKKGIEYWHNGAFYVLNNLATPGKVTLNVDPNSAQNVGIQSGRYSYHNWSLYDFTNAYRIIDMAQDGSGKVGIGTNQQSTGNLSARLHVKGSGNTFATTSLLVENSNGDDLIKVLDSGRTSIGLNAINSNDNNVVFGNSASASGSTNNSVVIGTNSNITNSLNSVAVGGATLASGSSSSIAIGPAYINGVEAIAIGNSSRSNIGAVSIGHDSGSENNTGSYNLCLGTRAKNTSNANNVIVLNATGSTTATSGTTDDTFSVFMTSNTSPDFKVIGNEGMIPPNITTVTRDAIASPTVGSTIYNTTDNKLQYYDGTSWQSLSNEPYLNVFDTSPASPDPLSIYNDGIIQVWLDESTSDDIEVQVLTDPAGSALVNFTWWSPTGATDGFVNINAASGITATNINFNDYDVHQMSVFAPSDQSYPYYEIRVTKSGTAFSGVPAIIRVSKYTI